MQVKFWRIALPAVLIFLVLQLGYQNYEKQKQINDLINNVSNIENDLNLISDDLMGKISKKDFSEISKRFTSAHPIQGFGLNQMQIIFDENDDFLRFTLDWEK